MGLGEEREIRAQKAISPLISRKEKHMYVGGNPQLPGRSKIRQKQLFYMFPDSDPCIFTYFSIISFNSILIPSVRFHRTLSLKFVLRGNSGHGCQQDRPGLVPFIDLPPVTTLYMFNNYLLYC